MPQALTCLIVGENPGSATAAYFYDEHHSVAVRTILLHELHRGGIIRQPTLPAFHAAGFLFDHGIRCRLTGDDIGTERRLSRHYKSVRAAAADHLKPHLKHTRLIWVMGYVARNAVASACPEFPRDVREISGPPYPGEAPGAPRFFVSRYLTRSPGEQVAAIFREFGSFWEHNLPVSRAATSPAPVSPKVPRSTATTRPTPQPVSADDLAKWRRQLLRLLDRLDGKAVPNVGPMARITRLKNGNVIPRETAALMIVVTEARNAAEYAGKQPTPIEGEAVRSAWAAILDWARTRGIEPEA
jgi:hypothetical protein